MHKKCFFIIGMFISSFCHSQNTTAQNNVEGSLLIIDLVQSEVSFPGGSGVMKKFLEKRYIIPDSLVIAGVVLFGTITAAFTIEKDGSLSEFEITQSVNSILDNEWLRVLKMMPKWIPAIQNGKPVKVKNKLSIIICSY